MKGLESEGELSSFYEPIKRNKLDFFTQKPDPIPGALKQKVLKDDCRLSYSIIYIFGSNVTNTILLSSKRVMPNFFNFLNDPASFQRWLSCRSNYITHFYGNTNTLMLHELRRPNLKELQIYVA